MGREMVGMPHPVKNKDRWHVVMDAFRKLDEIAAKGKLSDVIRQSLYLGVLRIEELRLENIAPDGSIWLPFRCYQCDKMKTEVALIDGDGCPHCRDCMGETPPGFHGRPFTTSPRPGYDPPEEPKKHARIFK